MLLGWVFLSAEMCPSENHCDIGQYSGFDNAGAGACYPCSNICKYENSWVDLEICDGSEYESSDEDHYPDYGCVPNSDCGAGTLTETWDDLNAPRECAPCDICGPGHSGNLCNGNYDRESFEYWESQGAPRAVPNEGSIYCEPCLNAQACAQGQYIAGDCSSLEGTDDTSSCEDCMGGAAYDCGAGSYRTGTTCGVLETGHADIVVLWSTEDTQTCAPCDRGAAYDCGAGLYRTGFVCDGTGYDNAQTCAPCEGGAAYDCGLGAFRTGTECKGTGSDSQVCDQCTGGATYDCGQGFFRSGGSCVGTGDANEQTCTECTGGATYDCPSGCQPIGPACDGSGTSNTQSCVCG